MNAFDKYTNMQLVKALSSLNTFRHMAINGGIKRGSYGPLVVCKASLTQPLTFAHWVHYSGNPDHPVPAPNWPRAPMQAAEWASYKQRFSHPKYLKLNMELTDWLIQQALQLLSWRGVEIWDGQ